MKNRKINLLIDIIYTNIDRPILNILFRCLKDEHRYAWLNNAVLLNICVKTHTVPYTSESRKA